MANKATAVDIGSHSAKILVAQASKHGVKLLRFAGLPHGDTENTVSLGAAGIPLSGVHCGLAGRDMTLRYSQVPPTPDWQLRNLMDLEIQDLAQQSGGKLSADYNLLPPQDPEAGVDTVLLALAKDEALDRLQAELKAAGGSAGAFVPNCTALFNAYLKCGPVEADAVVCLVSIGHQTTDLCIVKGTDLLFARNLTSGTKVLDDAIASSFNVSERKAEALKKDLLDLDPASRGRYASGQAEKVTLAATAAAGAIPAAIQSSLSFCKAQTKLADLRLDKVLVAGGGARLRGIRGLLREALRCPVELFDPFANLDLSSLPAEDQEQLEAMRHEAVIALGLAVGPLDDTLYSLEILPDAVKRRLRFQQRTVFNVLAAVVVIAVLFLKMNHLKAQLEANEDAGATLRRQVSKATSINNQAETLIEANKVERALVQHLAQQALPLNGLLGVQRAIGVHLSPQLWIEKLDVSGAGASNSRNRQPAIVFEAAGKELNGVQVSTVMVDFVTAFKTDPALQGLKQPTMEQMPATDGTPRIKVTVGLTEEKN